jgi:ABC-type phosphate/phosphonate transport system ATPase subunit
LMDDARRAASHGQTVIFSTHNINVVNDYADRVIALDKGKVVSDEIRA